jgi:hypothetical protein
VAQTCGLKLPAKLFSKIELVMSKNVIENLNLMTRLELNDTVQFVEGQASEHLKALLHSKPHVPGIEPKLDLFVIEFSADILEDISFALETVTWDMAQTYAKKVEEATNTADDDAQFQRWQQLQEKWGYLEMTA